MISVTGAEKIDLFCLIWPSLFYLHVKNWSPQHDLYFCSLLVNFFGLFQGIGFCWLFVCVTYMFGRVCMYHFYLFIFVLSCLISIYFRLPLLFHICIILQFIRLPPRWFFLTLIYFPLFITPFLRHLIHNFFLRTTVHFLSHSFYRFLLIFLL